MDEKTIKYLSEKFYQINDKTGFYEGDLFDNENELREYFNNNNPIFENCKLECTQNELNDMFDWLISHKEKLEEIDLKFIQ